MRFRYPGEKIDELFANSADSDQTPRSAASDLGLHCLTITLLGVSRLQWVKKHRYIVNENDSEMKILSPFSLLLKELLWKERICPSSLCEKLFS